MNMKTAPVQSHKDMPAGQIPWALHELAWEEYARQGHMQSAQRIADRGGFSWAEIVACLRGEYTFVGIQIAQVDLDRSAL